jgi:hypothetical protein
VNLFDGLHNYEIALLVGGAMFLVVLVIAFLRLVFTGGKYAGLFPFFLFPILMMGFPAISVIQIQKDSVEITKVTDDLHRNPDDTAARATLEADVSRIADRPFNDPTRLTTLAQAQFALGQEGAATANVSKALNANPNLPAAVNLNKKIDLTRNLTALTTAAESQPNNVQVHEQLKSTYSQLSQTQLANPKALVTMSKAKLVLEENTIAPGH